MKLVDLPNCSSCPRLVEHRAQLTIAYPKYFNAPVPEWGDSRGRLMILGLAPGLHGAARTGKAFVGDSSGDLLFAALHTAGFASHKEAGQAKLRGARITNAVKCLPPANAPTASEVNQCRHFLTQELGQFASPGARKPRCIVALGGTAYRSLQRTLAVKLPPFGHAQHCITPQGLHVIASYHPSRLNVNTGRINLAMMTAIFEQAKNCLLDGCVVEDCT